jgi:HNH endonuclease
MAEAVPVPAPTEKDLRRFKAKIEVQPDGCHLWIGAKFGQGYGAFRLHGKMRRAHRVAYVWSYGEIPAGHSGLDHICNNRACVNPDHLRPSTHLENVLRGVGPTAENARRETCVNGHPLDYADPRGWRGCRQCRNEAVARYTERNREKINARRRAARQQ